MIDVVCQTCFATFKAYPSANRRYCSQSCYTPVGRKGEDMRGENNPKWRGGVMDENGRKLIYAPDHPNAKRGYVYEYRIVASEMLGRPLVEGEIVHHIDGDITNNAKENLQVMTQSEHASLHFTEIHAANRRAITHCKNGHEFTEQNTKLRADGASRRCRICSNADARRQYATKRGLDAHTTP